jgi:hypothetical protein
MFKCYRMKALQLVAKSLREARPPVRAAHECLVTGAILMYMFNALIFRPAEGRAESALLAAASQHGLQKNNVEPLIYERGIYFLSSLDKIEGAFQLPTSRDLNDNFLAVLYRRDCLDDVKAEMALDGKSIDPTGTGSRRLKRSSTKRKHLAVLATGFLDAEDMDGENDDKESGDEGENNGEENDESEGLNGLDNPHSQMIQVEKPVINQIVRQFPICVMQAAPKPKSKTDSPYLLLQDNDRQSVSIDIFKSFDFKKVFHRAQFKIFSKDEWHSKIFPKFFPLSPLINDSEPTTNHDSWKKPKRSQGFVNALYLDNWEKLLLRADAKVMQNYVFDSWFRHIHWLPFPEVDRMWHCDKPIRGWTLHNLSGLDEKSGRYPKLAINAEKWLEATK